MANTARHLPQSAAVQTDDPLPRGKALWVATVHTARWCVALGFHGIFFGGVGEAL